VIARNEAIFRYNGKWYKYMDCFVPRNHAHLANAVKK